MKRIERHAYRNCPGCGIRFAFGAMLEDWNEELKRMGLKKVYGLYPRIEQPDLSLKFEDCDGVFMSDIIRSDMRCPACDTGVMHDVEVEYSDYCRKCGCTKDVREAAFHTGVEWECWECQDELSESFDPKSRLSSATSYGVIEVVRSLLAVGVDPDIGEDDLGGNTALMIAAMNSDAKHIEIGRLLIDHGANVNLQDSIGWTALFKAARHNNAEFAKLLIAHGADVTLRDQWGRTALELAVQVGFEEVAAILNTCGVSQD